MSSASLAENFVTPSTSAPLSVALRNIFLTLTLTVASLALAGFLWREQGYEMLIVTMGWPHVTLGFVFYLGRVVRGETNAREGFVMLALLTLAIWIIHYNFAITGLIYLYFLYHAFRDELTVYLQTRARHRPGAGVYAVAGVGPAILLMLLIPQQQNFRHDLRRAEFSDAQITRDGWTLISFKPVPNSRGRDFYFYLQAPHTDGVRTFTTDASATDERRDGEILVNDRRWPQASDLVFQPHYAGLPASAALAETATIPVLLTGGHRVGQSFRARENNLDGIRLPIDRLEPSATQTNFVFHLASPPLLPYSPAVADARLILIVLLSVLIAWKLLWQRRLGNQIWIYLLVIAGGFAVAQMILKSSNNAGYAFPLIFQFVVVFHYWSWYVFSFDKLRVMRTSPPPGNANLNRYDRVLARLRSMPSFAAFVVVLTLLSGLGVFWYYKLNGPGALRFGFDYNYFLYFLVFHVTFSFHPKLRLRSASR